MAHTTFAWDDGNPLLPESSDGPQTYTGTSERSSGTIVTFNIPLEDWPEEIDFSTVRGGDGGRATAEPSSGGSDKVALGGGGALINAVFAIDLSETDALRPGGEIRIIVGNKGEGESRTYAAGAGGGGATGILYKAPIDGSDWVPLVIAGGGGGGVASVVSSNTFSQEGRNANEGLDGDDGGGRSGSGGVNGQAGEGRGNMSGGGGGLLSQDNHSMAGEMADPEGARGGTRLHGGFGYIGGGAGRSRATSDTAQGQEVAGGGGAGYSGGGGGDIDEEGGGGGSYLDERGTGTIESREGTNDNGTVEFTSGNAVNDELPGATFDLSDSVFTVAPEIFVLPDGSATDYYGNTIVAIPDRRNINRANPRVYNVIYTWTDQFGRDEQATRVIEIIAPPEADFTVDYPLGVASHTVQFTDTTTNNPVEWEWDFDGDGMIDSTEQNPTFTYTSPGIYSVTLTVTNGTGDTALQDSMTKVDWIEVLDAEFVNADFSSTALASGDGFEDSLGQGWYAKEPDNGSQPTPNWSAGLSEGTAGQLEQTDNSGSATRISQFFGVNLSGSHWALTFDVSGTGSFRYIRLFGAKLPANPTGQAFDSGSDLSLPAATLADANGWTQLINTGRVTNASGTLTYTISEDLSQYNVMVIQIKGDDTTVGTIYDNFRFTPGPPGIVNEDFNNRALFDNDGDFSALGKGWYAEAGDWSTTDTRGVITQLGETGSGSFFGQFIYNELRGRGWNFQFDVVGTGSYDDVLMWGGTLAEAPSGNSIVTIRGAAPSNNLVDANGWTELINASAVSDVTGTQSYLITENLSDYNVIVFKVKGDSTAGSMYDNFRFNRNIAPSPTDDAYVTNNETVIMGNLLDNDIEPDGNPIRIFALREGPLGEEITLHSGARLTVSTDGTFTYDPVDAEDFRFLHPREVVFENLAYAISDGHSTAPAGFTIAVYAIGYEYWAAINGYSDFSADDDGDGVANVFDYISSDFQRLGIIDSDTVGPLLENAPEDVVLSIEYSLDLETWTEIIRYTDGHRAISAPGIRIRDGHIEHDFSGRFFFRYNSRLRELDE